MSGRVIRMLFGVMGSNFKYMVNEKTQKLQWMDSDIF